MATPDSLEINAPLNVCEVSNPRPERSHIFIVTEEYPQKDTVVFVCRHLGIELSETVPYEVNIVDSKWDGTFNLFNTSNHICGKMELVKGKGSFVDYLVYDTDSPSKDTQPILAVEATKVRDGDSRNCSVNQRLTKLRCIQKRFPGLPTENILMYYERPFPIRTATVRFGLRLLVSNGFGAYDTDGNLTTKVLPFENLDELVREKNSIATPANGVPVRMTKLEGNTICISAKLSKGRNTRICHDPNIGLVSGLVGAVTRLDPTITNIRITNHYVDVDTLEGSNAKFWYANSEVDMQLEGSSVSSLGRKPPSDAYWVKDNLGEKASTILCHMLCDTMDYMEVIYHNHASSARSSLKTPSGSYIDLTKKIRIPDIVIRDTGRSHIYIVEGKDKGHYKEGDSQLDDQGPFIEVVRQHYPDHAFSRVLCLAVRDIDSIPETRHRVIFALDEKGSHVLRL